MTSPIPSYIRRYWPLLALVAVLIAAFNLSALGTALRGSILIPMLGTIALLSSLLLRNVFNRDTTDKFVKAKASYKAAWNGLSDYEKMFLTKLELGTYFLGTCLLGAGLLIIINVG